MPYLSQSVASALRMPIKKNQQPPQAPSAPANDAKPRQEFDDVLRNMLASPPTPKTKKKVKKKIPSP